MRTVGHEELGFGHVYLQDRWKAVIIIISHPICWGPLCAKKCASYSLLHLITQPVPLSKVGIASPTFCLGDVSMSGKLWNSRKVTQQVGDTAGFWPSLPYSPTLARPVSSKLPTINNSLAHLPVKIISSQRKKQGGWLKPMLIYLGRLFTRLLKELSDSANFNQVIVKQPWIPPCTAKNKYKRMTQHKPAVVFSASHYPHPESDE